MRASQFSDYAQAPPRAVRGNADDDSTLALLGASDAEPNEGSTGTIVSVRLPRLPFSRLIPKNITCLQSWKMCKQDIPELLK